MKPRVSQEGGDVSLGGRTEMVELIYVQMSLSQTLHPPPHSAEKETKAWGEWAPCQVHPDNQGQPRALGVRSTRCALSHLALGIVGDSTLIIVILMGREA